MTQPMNDTPEPANTPVEPPASPSPAAAPAGSVKKQKKEDSFPVFLVKLVLIVAIFRSFFFSPFNIPSESMLPRLENGDYLLAAKWPYGFSRYSMPFSLPLLPKRIFANQPHRGDVVIFKAPPGNDVDYIKRVIGVPGDTVQMIGGVLHLNGKAVPKLKIADFVIRVSTNTECISPDFAVTEADGTQTCHYPQFQETLPGGKTYNVLDLGYRPQDDTPPVVVPEGKLFLMGDNRDNSMDSRYKDAVGFVPYENFVGRADIIFFSIEPSTSFWEVWRWPLAIRWSRFFNLVN